MIPWYLYEMCSCCPEQRNVVVNNVFVESILGSMKHVYIFHHFSLYIYACICIACVLCFVVVNGSQRIDVSTWWRHQMETFSALLALCAGNSPVSGEFPSQRSVMRSFDVFLGLRLNNWLSKQSWGWWFETPSCSLWRHCNDLSIAVSFCIVHPCIINLQGPILLARSY